MDEHKHAAGTLVNVDAAKDADGAARTDSQFGAAVSVPASNAQITAPSFSPLWLAYPGYPSPVPYARQLTLRPIIKPGISLFAARKTTYSCVGQVIWDGHHHVQPRAPQPLQVVKSADGNGFFPTWLTHRLTTEVDLSDIHWAELAECLDDTYVLFHYDVLTGRFHIRVRDEWQKHGILHVDFLPHNNGVHFHYAYYDQARAHAFAIARAEYMARLEAAVRGEAYPLINAGTYKAVGRRTRRKHRRTIHYAKRSAYIPSPLATPVHFPRACIELERMNPLEYIANRDVSDGDPTNYMSQEAQKALAAFSALLDMQDTEAKSVDAKMVESATGHIRQLLHIVVGSDKLDVPYAVRDRFQTAMRSMMERFVHAWSALDEWDACMAIIQAGDPNDDRNTSPNMRNTYWTLRNHLIQKARDKQNIRVAMMIAMSQPSMFWYNSDDITQPLLESYLQADPKPELPFVVQGPTRPKEDWRGGLGPWLAAEARKWKSTQQLQIGFHATTVHDDDTKRTKLVIKVDSICGPTYRVEYGFQQGRLSWLSYDTAGISHVITTTGGIHRYKDRSGPTYYLPLGIVTPSHFQEFGMGSNDRWRSYYSDDDLRADVKAMLQRDVKVTVDMYEG